MQTSDLPVPRPTAARREPLSPFRRVVRYLHEPRILFSCLQDAREEELGRIGVQLESSQLMTDTVLLKLAA